MASVVHPRICFLPQGASSLAGRLQTCKQINDTTTPSSLLQKHKQYVLGTQRRHMLDGAWARESEILAHSPWRKEMSSVSAKIVWVPVVGKETDRQQQREKRLWTLMSLSAAKVNSCFYRPWNRSPFQGHQTACVWVIWESEPLDTLTRFGFRVTAMGLGLSALMGSSWRPSYIPSLLL